ncbi:MAG: hypothetical protein J0J06_02255 [Sphingomonas sp.]|uniref:hypothetical protein n=1 Tax=Sphingomonas sp. TaxID=28214 RepID=UPI001ACCAC4B|nr:hypothetical protein [Sphingomonas sp.]MBN8814252.1 hypothetical protein [Sphingomonas sp.]
MTDQDPSKPAVHGTGDEARAGETSGHMRYVLLISIVLAIGILSAIVWVPVLLGK